MTSKDKKESKLSFENDFELKDEIRLKLRPEDIVKEFDVTDTLPEDYCPYGTNYSIDKSKFMGDEPPSHQFARDGHKLWEVINDGDNILRPVYFSLPTPPPLELIDGHGLDRDEQYFRRLEVPRKFKLIEQKALQDLSEIENKNRQDTIQGYKFYLRFWEIIEEEQENLVDEIQWLKNVWWWRTFGYWCYIDGEPTYLPPDYFDFLNFYFIDEAVCYPEYRDDVRRKFCFSWYLENCTETFKDVDNSGRAMKNSEGKYDMLDLGRRLFFGDVEPKTRRTGATHEAIHKILKGAITHLSYFSTIISFEGNNAETHYKKKLLPAFDAYPMCLKPIWEGNRRPKILRLDAPPNIYTVRGLKSAIAYSDSGGLFKNEGDRLNGILNDEQGKGTNLSSDIFERWHVNKYTMSTGMGINILKGVYVKNPSTVEQMEDDSAPYKKMCDLSDFYVRVPIKGQTTEGFARVFLPAYLRLEGYIDKFGKSVVETPTERQIALSPAAIFAMSKKGAKESMQAERDALLMANTPESLELYRSIKRKSPFEWSECWLGSAGNAGFNLEIIDKRLSEINKDKSFNKPPYRIGNFYRENISDNNSRVLWRDDIMGRWEMSISIPPELTNQRIRCDYFDPIEGKWLPSWKPVHGERFTCGVDPFRSITKADSKNTGKITGSASNSRQSDGGISVYWEYDESIDRGKDRLNWLSDRCVCVYRARPATQEEYFEDVIMTLHYFGAMCYPEYNVERVVSHLIERGLWGYFLFDIDILTGKPKAMPGRYTSTDTWSDGFSLVKDHIEFRGHAECHDKLLNEIKAIRGPESMTHLDLAAAFIMSKFGSKSRHRGIISRETQQPTVNLGNIGIFRKRYI
jgi:hypothetical protein